MGLLNPFPDPDWVLDASEALHGDGLGHHVPQAPLEVIFDASIWVSTVWFIGALNPFLDPDWASDAPGVNPDPNYQYGYAL